MVVVLTGVSGTGKTTIGRILAERLRCRFLDADDYHPAANVAKMSAGIALEDADRWPWLESLNVELRAAEARGECAVLACSALKPAYRERLAAGLTRCRFAFLRGSPELIARRVAARQHRYMPASLLHSQFAALEAPANAIVVDVEAPVETCVDVLARALGASSPRP